MARQARVISEYLHIVVRGIGKQILFEDGNDRRHFLKKLKKYADETEITVLAYCLMDNHVHLLVRDMHSRVSVFMKKICVGYSEYYNKKYDRTGHLFQDRFRSENVETESYFLNVFRYILLNPEKAGIASADKYIWSSYREYGKSGGITDTSMICELIGNEKQFADFMRRNEKVECLEDEKPKHDDAWALELIKKTLYVSNGNAIQNMEKSARDSSIRKLKSLGISVRQLERITGINRGIIQRI